MSDESFARIEGFNFDQQMEILNRWESRFREDYDLGQRENLADDSGFSRRLDVYYGHVDARENILTAMERLNEALADPYHQPDNAEWKNFNKENHELFVYLPLIYVH